LFLYRKANRIISLSPAFLDHLVERGINTDKQEVVTNGVDTEFFNIKNVQFNARERLGIRAEDFLYGYIGTVGMAHGLETILDAAELLRDHTDLYFLILGEGAERQELESKARARGLLRVLFHDFVPHGEVPSFLAALDVSIVHLKPDPVFKRVIPSKIFESMAMGIPILCAVEGLAARIVTQAKAGVCINSGEAQAMADTILKMKKGHAGTGFDPVSTQAAVTQHYGRRAKAAEMIRCFDRVLSSTGSVPEPIAEKSHSPTS
jgi:glycosyltransferase involved in cell wall biosynthesis